MYCKKCGNELEEDTKFCPKCGYANDNESLKNESLKKEPLKKKSSIVKIMGGIIAGLVVVLIVIVVIALFSGGGGASDTQQETDLKIVQEGSILSVPELNMKEVVENYWVDGTWSCFHGETESGAEALVVQYEKEKEGLIQFLVDLEQQNFVIGLIKDETNQIDEQSIMAIDLEGDMQSNPDLDHIKEINKLYSKYGYDKISLKNIDFLDYIKGNAEDLLKNTGSLQEEDDIISDALNQLTIMTDQNEMTMITIQGNKEYSPTFAGVCIGDGDYKEKLKEKNYLEKQGDDGATYYIDENGEAGIFIELDEEGNVEKINWMDDITEYTSFEEVEETVEPTIGIDTEFSQDRIGFYSNGYWGMNIKSIDNTAKEVIYDGYEDATMDIPSGSDWKAEIIDANTLDFYDTIIRFDTDGFTITDPKDALIMGRGVGGVNSYDLTHAAGKYTKMEKPTQEQNNDQVTSSIVLYPGYYDDSRSYGEDPTCPDDSLRLVISNVTDYGFDFKMLICNRWTNTQNVTFKQHTAVFTGNGDTAAYYGQQYTLYFQFPSITDITVTGFDEAEGILFQNGGIPGHCFG